MRPFGTKCGIAGAQAEQTLFLAKITGGFARIQPWQRETTVAARAAGAPRFDHAILRYVSYYYDSGKEEFWIEAPCFSKFVSFAVDFPSLG
jgi:hypothetical protein